MTKHIALMFLLAAACGDGDKGAGTAAGTGGAAVSTTAATTGSTSSTGSGGAGGGSMGPGELTINVDGLTDASGKAVVVFVYPPGGNIGTATAGTCLLIAGSPFTGSDKVRARIGMGNPCDLEMTPKVLDAGTQNVYAGLFTPGSMTPEKCAQTTAQIQGNTTLTLPQLGACTP